MGLCKNNTSKITRLMLEVFIFHTIAWYGSNFEVELFLFLQNDWHPIFILFKILH